MSDRGLGYWLRWPHTKRDHGIAFVFFLAVTLAGGATDQIGVTVVAGMMTVLVGVRLMAWNAADPEARAEDTNLFGGGEAFEDDERSRDAGYENDRKAGRK